ncbi:MAG: hypothetical protein IJ025_06635 [Clostridia bacterium]|nr:hypothetical protein [Clostridia bacterium]
MSNNTNKKKITEESSLSEIQNHIQISKLSKEWSDYCDAALNYEQMTEEERAETRKTVFDSVKFEKLISDTYDAFAPHAFDSRVPKYVLDLYVTIRSFSEISFFKKAHDGIYQFRTAIATSLCHLLDERTELSEENRMIIFYLDETQSKFNVGYYIYDFDISCYKYIGEENPFA